MTKGKLAGFRCARKIESMAFRSPAERSLNAHDDGRLVECWRPVEESYGGYLFEHITVIANVLLTIFIL